MTQNKDQLPFAVEVADSMQNFENPLNPKVIASFDNANEAHEYFDNFDNFTPYINDGYKHAILFCRTADINYNIMASRSF